MTDSRKRTLLDIEDGPVHTHDKQPRLGAQHSVVSEMISDDESEETQITRPIDTPERTYFPLYKKGVTFAWACVSPSRLQDVLAHRWGESQDGYPVNGKGRHLHAFVYYDLMECERCEAIDHRNNDKRDATDINLMGGTHAENLRNRKKKTGLSSEFHGVVWDRDYWRSHKKYFHSEKAAAWFHDQFEQEHHPKSQNLNHVTKPDDYSLMCVQGTKRHPKEDRNISDTGGNLRWRVRFNRNQGDISRSFATKVEAIVFRDATLNKWEEEKLNAIANLPITRNEDGIACIHNSKTRGVTVLMDDQEWRFLQDKDLHLPSKSSKYAFFHFEGKLVTLHKYVMYRLKQEDKLVIDHINLNSFDNRRSNLRVIGSSLNNQNSASRAKGSPYKGVTPQGQKWRSNLNYKGTQYYLGSYETSILAACAYNAMATEIYAPEIPWLNSVQVPVGYVWNSNTKRVMQC
jgi:hypothetical protein